MEKRKGLKELMEGRRGSGQAGRGAARKGDAPDWVGCSLVCQCCWSTVWLGTGHTPMLLQAQFPTLLLGGVLHTVLP